MKLVHTREISIRTSDLGDHHILVEGTLVDHRFQPTPQTSEASELVHHLAIRFTVKGPEILINRAEATMPHHPRKECPEVLPSFRNLEGVRIAPGYSMKVKKIIGGIKGCAHLTSLVISMGESAVQGYWAAFLETWRKSNVVPFIPTATMGWDPLPWQHHNPSVSSSVPSRWVLAPEQFQSLLAKVKAMIGRHAARQSRAPHAAAG